MSLGRCSMLIIFIAINFITTFSYAQEKLKALERPEKFKEPLLHLLYEEKTKNTSFTNQPSKADKGEVWFVMADNHGVNTYEKPTDSSPTKYQLEFKEIYYVISEDLEWLEIAKAKGYVKNRKIKNGTRLGWVRKSDVLLWNHGGRDPYSKIHAKAYILNQGTDIGSIVDAGTKDFAKLYNSSTGGEVLSEIKLYEFYFLYKISDTNPKRYLIGRESFFPSTRVDDVILGWVESSKVTPWNTRICLEPNFEKAAYEERQSNNKDRIVGFNNRIAALTATEEGINDGTKDILWDNDPAFKNSASISDENPRRFKGEVVRFPLLGATKRDDDDVYIAPENRRYLRTATIGKIETKSIEGIQIEGLHNNDSIEEGEVITIAEETLDIMRSRKSNLNIFFIVEGSPENSHVRQSINDVVDGILEVKPIGTKVKFGACIYKDAAEKKRDKDIQILEMTSSRKEVINFIQNEDFVTVYDNDPENAIHYAIQQSLILGGFDKEATNVICVLASNADISQNTTRKLTQKINNEEAYFVEQDELINKLNNYDPHFLIVQSQFNNKSSHVYFQNGLRELLLGQAYRNYKGYKQFQNHVAGLETPVPVIGDFSSTQNLISLDNSFIRSKMLRPAFEENITDETATFIKNSIEEINNAVAQTYSNLSKIIVTGEGISPESGTWEPAVANLLWKSFSKKSENEGDIKNSILKMFQEKYRLYFELNLPTKYPGAIHPLYSYVVFMPHEDLEEYQRVLSRLAEASSKDVSEQRESLYEAFVELMRQMTGDSKSKINKATITDFKATLQGIQKEGYFIGEKIDIRIEHLLNHKIVSDEQIIDLTESIVKKMTNIKRIKDLKDKYEFSYNPNELNTYYWIPENLLF